MKRSTASRSRTSLRLLPSRWRCGADRSRRCIRGPRAAWVFLLGWRAVRVMGLASQGDALSQIQPRMDREGRQDDEEEQQCKKHVVHLRPPGSSRLLTCWQSLSRPAIQQLGYGSAYFRQVCCTMQQTGHTKRISAEYLSRYFLASEICDSYFAACSKMALDRFNASESAESWADVRSASFASIPSLTPGITTAA